MASWCDKDARWKQVEIIVLVFSHLPPLFPGRGGAGKRKLLSYQKAVWYRHKSHLLASVKSEALQVAGRLSSSVPGGCAGPGSPCLMTIGSSVHQDQAITNSKSNHYLHLYYLPNSDTYPIGLDIESSMSMFSMNAEQNGTCCHKLVIPSRDRDKCKLGLILVTK